MLVKEEDEISRLKRVIEFATCDDCSAVALGEYFGDPAGTVPGDTCQTCSWCKSCKLFSLPLATLHFL